MRLFRLFAALALSLTVLVGAVPAFAQTTPAPASQACDCWCTSSTGAKKEDAKATSTTACQTACQGQNERMIVCSDRPAFWPANNLRCFASEDECKMNCERPSPDASTPQSTAHWDRHHQPSECLPGSHYCYCLGQPYTLAHEIGGTKQVADYGSYVETVYRWLLGIAGTVAIIMIMVGGLQYVLSAGGADVGKAKARMKNAVIGLVLLFAAALLLETVNPRLLTLQPPRLPALKRIELLTENTRCVDLAEKGYVIEGYTKGQPNRTCGETAVVLRDPNGSNVAEGTTCRFTHCPAHAEGQQGCFMVPGEGGVMEGKCAWCGDIVPDEGQIPIIPSSAVCSGLTTPPASNRQFSQCFWTREPSMLFGLNWTSAEQIAGITGGAVIGNFIPFPGATAMGAAIGAGATGALELRHGVCAELKYDCNLITTCEGFNSSALQVRNKKTDNELYDIGPGWGDLSMQEVCLQNTCTDNNGVRLNCIYNAETNRCLTPILGQGATGDHCNSDTDCIGNMVCNTRWRNSCVLPNSGEQGTSCTRDIECDGTCNTAFEPDACVRNGSLARGQDCERNVQCASNRCTPSLIPFRDNTCE